MVPEQDPIGGRVAELERQVKIPKGIAGAAAVVTMVLASVPHTQAQQATDALRVRQLIVEDAAGRARMVFGYLDAPGNTRRIGMRINDPAGAERFGLSFIDNGSLVMGFDAPPGTGNDANRERITIAADEKGGAHLRFLDRRTNVVSRMYLDDQNRVWMQFSDFTQTPPVIRRYGLTGEEVIQPTRPVQ
jgi:hypothetical protein